MPLSSRVAVHSPMPTAIGSWSHASGGPHDVDEVMVQGDRPAAVLRGDRPRPARARIDPTHRVELAAVLDDIPWLQLVRMDHAHHRLLPRGRDVFVDTYADGSRFPRNATLVHQ